LPTVALAPLLAWSLACRTAVPPTAAADPAESARVPSADPGDPASASDISVAVVHDPDADAWTVTWRFPEPVPGAVFPRDRHRFREGGWTLLTEGVSWVGTRYGEALLADDPGQPVSELSVRFASDFTNREKDYTLNLPFTDGGRLLYTGHLAVHPLAPVPDGATWAEGAAPHHWTLTTAPGRSVRLLDRTGDGSLSWRDDDPDRSGGTYAFVGSIEALQTDALTAIVDPGLPAWMRDETLRALPELFATFTERTGHALDFHPLILVGFDPDGEGTELKGGSLDGLLQLFAGGAGWAEETPAARERWLWFLGHESFHFWNSQRFERRGGRWEEWVSEGLSDLYAMRGLQALGVIDDRRAQQYVARAGNRCLLGLHGTGLLTDRKPYGTYYACGAVLLWLLDDDLRERTAGEVDLDALLNRTWQRALDGDGRWSTMSLLEEAVLAADDPNAVGWLLPWLYTEPPLPADLALAEALAEAGLAVALGPVDEAALEVDDHRKALGTLLSRCGCPGGLVRGDDGHVAWEPGEGCALEAPAATVAGVSLDDAAAAHAAAAAQLQATNAVRLGDATAGATLVCDADRSWSQLLVLADR
jgi:hypothetical protein